MEEELEMEKGRYCKLSKSLEKKKSLQLTLKQKRHQAADAIKKADKKELVAEFTFRVQRKGIKISNLMDIN